DRSVRRKTPEAQRPHRFKPAEWTHPNGHPRCLVCGDEEPIGGLCNNPAWEHKDVTGGGSGEGDSTTMPPAFGAHSFVLGRVEDANGKDVSRVNPYEAIFLRPWWIGSEDRRRKLKYDESEARDERGRWTATGALAAIGAPTTAPMSMLERTDIAQSLATKFE